MNKNISYEENIIQKIIFDQDLNKNDFFKIDLRKFINIASSHLVLPLLYKKLKKNKNDKFFSDEFIQYLSKIYKLNENRNLKLIDEIKLISEFLNENNFDHVFLKGSALLMAKSYENVGDRMIGDIDLLVSESDGRIIFNKLQEIGYKPIEKNDFRMKYKKHFSRQVNSEKLFAVEVHDKFFKYKKKNSLNPKKILEEKKSIDGVNVPKNKVLLLHNIYNQQINDIGSTLLSYSYRNLYDTYLLLKSKNKIKLSKDKLDKDFRIYFTILNELKINFELNYVKKLFFKKLVFRMKLKHKNFRSLHNILINIFTYLNDKLYQILSVLTEKNYRTYVFRKFFTLKVKN